MTAAGDASRAVTIREVAQEAGVGVGTASRVLSGQGSVSEAARLRVEEAARRLRYRPSAIGRVLRSRRSQNLGLIVADISNNFYGEFTEAVLGSAQRSNRHVIIGASGEHPQREREYIELLLEQRVAGIIAFPTGENADVWQSALDLGVRVVFADRTVPGIEVPSVVVDNRHASRALTEYLLALGHTRIGYLGGPTEVTTATEREQGFRSAHHDAGVPVVEELVVRSRFTRDTAHASALRLVSHRPSAIVATNNVLGEAAVRVLADEGVEVPSEVSVAMFDDVPWAQIVRPAMTVIDLPAARMGEEAMRLVEETGDGRGPLVLRANLVVRGSTAPPRPSVAASAPASSL